MSENNLTQRAKPEQQPIQNGGAAVAVIDEVKNGLTSFDDLQRLCRLLAASGFFSDAKDVSQACVKVLAGAEMGFGPVTSMNNIYIISTMGATRIQIGANLMAIKVRRAGYNYKVLSLTAEKCEIEFLDRNGESLGKSDFTIGNAEAAGLVKAGSAWEAHPRNMLFARAMSNGVKWYCPDAIGATVYVEGEIDPSMGERMLSDPAEYERVRAEKIGDAKNKLTEMRRAKGGPGLTEEDLNTEEQWRVSQYLSKEQDLKTPAEQKQSLADWHSRSPRYTGRQQHS